MEKNSGLILVLPKKKIKRIVIIGLGLLGGSLALVLKSKGYYTIGITRSQKTITIAKKKKVINEGYTKLNHKVLNKSDLIVLTCPLNLIPEYISKIASVVKKGIILTDVGSTKYAICNLAKKVLPQNITFVGGHPMAGTEKSGFVSAQTELFKNCAWFLTPFCSDLKKSKIQQALSQLKMVIKDTGAIPLEACPEEHDKAVALISHLPLLVSLALSSLVKNCRNKKVKKLALLAAAGGFRDTTRISGGNPILSTDLILSNSNNLKSILPLYLKELKSVLSFTQRSPKQFLKYLTLISNWRNNLYDQKPS